MAATGGRRETASLPTPGTIRMTVRTLFFAIYRDLAGTSELSVVLPDSARVADLVESLRGRGGSWTRLPASPAVAVNMEYASLSHVLSDGDEVALIPPVGGGAR
jgi:molybdopterin converting factor subunit 1